MNFFMCYLLIFLLTTSLNLLSQTSLPVVSETVPRILFLEAGGKQVNTIFRGDQLAELEKVFVKNLGATAKTIFTQLAPPSSNSRGVVFIASPVCQIGSNYTVHAVSKNGTVIDIPMSLTVVPLGDPRATLADTATLEQVTQKQNNQRIVVAEKLAPIVTMTKPNPLILAPKNQSQTVLLIGRNLESITEVRVRKFDAKPLYRGSQGILPSRIVSEGLEVDILVGPKTVLGSKFVLDLMVKKYLAASVSLTVGNLPELSMIQEVIPTLPPVPNEVVIPLRPKPNSAQ